MVDILYADGDSNTYGDEIYPAPFVQNKKTDKIEPAPTPDQEATFYSYRIANSWPGVLARLLGAHPINGAHPGSSNCGIFRRTIEWISENKEAITEDPSRFLVVIGWSEISRVEYYDDKEQWWHSMGVNFSHSDKKKAAGRYYSDLYTDHQGATKYAQYMASLSIILQSLSVRYLFFNAFENQRTDRKYLGNMIPDHVWISEPMHATCNTANHPKGEGGHFLEAGNAFWAQLLRDRYLGDV